MINPENTSTEFKNTSEFTYISTLLLLHGTLIEMLNSFTEEQLEVLLPVLNYSNDILNMPMSELNKDPKDMN